MRRGCFITAGPTPRLGTMFCGGGIAVCDDEDAHNSDGYGDDLAGADLLVENGDTEGVGEEGRAVVDGCKVTGCGLVHSHVPTSSGKCKGACDEGRHLEHVSYRRDLGLAGCWVEVLVLDHESGLAEELDVSSPEGRPWLAPVLET